MENKLHLYTGEGKGKTTAAMGLALRALGHGNRVLIAQLLKDGRSGELEALRRFENARILPAPPLEGFLWQMSEDERREEAARQCAYVRGLIEAVREFEPQTVVLDELAVAVGLGVVDEGSARALIDRCLVVGETVVTGRNAPEWLMEYADYVSRIDAVRHPYDTQGLAARQGVEW